MSFAVFNPSFANSGHRDMGGDMPTGNRNNKT